MRPAPGPDPCTAALATEFCLAGEPLQQPSEDQTKSRIEQILVPGVLRRRPAATRGEGIGESSPSAMTPSLVPGGHPQFCESPSPATPPSLAPGGRPMSRPRPRLARAGSQHPSALLIWREQRCDPSYSHLIPDEEMDFTRLPFSYSFPVIRRIREDQSPPHPSDCACLHSSIARSYAPSRSSIVLACR